LQKPHYYAINAHNGNRMNKFTLLIALAMGVGGKDYEIEDQIDI